MTWGIWAKWEHGKWGGNGRVWCETHGADPDRGLAREERANRRGARRVRGAHYEDQVFGEQAGDQADGALEGGGGGGGGG